MWDASPTPVLSVDRRASRLPPGLSLVDPFGYGLNDVSSYDAALQSIPSSPGIRPRASGSFTNTSSTLAAASPYPSSSTMSSNSSSGNGYLTSSAATSPVPWNGHVKSNGSGNVSPELNGNGNGQSWQKTGRSSSFGEGGSTPPNGSPPIGRNGFPHSPRLTIPGQGGMGPSKLSGEIDLDVSTFSLSYNTRTRTQPFPSHFFNRVNQKPLLLRSWLE